MLNLEHKTWNDQSYSFQWQLQRFYQINPNAKSTSWYAFFSCGDSTNFYSRRHRPEVQPLTLLFTIFDGKGTPFVQLLLTNDTTFTYLIQNEDCKKCRFFSFKIDFLSHSRKIFARSIQALQTQSAPGLFFDRSRVLDQRKNTGCFAGPVLNTAISRISGWFPTCGSSGGFIVNVINDIYR